MTPENSNEEKLRFEIATQVMGLAVYQGSEEGYKRLTTFADFDPDYDMLMADNPYSEVPHYPSNLSDAWQVMERLNMTASANVRAAIRGWFEKSNLWTFPEQAAAKQLCLIALGFVSAEAVPTTLPGLSLTPAQQKGLAKLLKQQDITYPERFIWDTLGDSHSLSTMTNISAQNLVKLATYRKGLTDRVMTPAELGYAGLANDAVLTALNKECIDKTVKGEKWE